MKLRYYMRGLGIGIIVTAIVLSISLHDRTKPMSDADVIERAKELGLEEKYDAGVLADGVSANTVEQSKEETKEAVKEDANKDTNKDTAKNEEVKPEDNKVDDAKVEETKQKEEVVEVTTNKQAEEALDRAEEAKETAKESAEEASKKAENAAEEASKLKVDTKETSKTEDKTVDGKPNKKLEEKEVAKSEDKKAEDKKTDDKKVDEKQSEAKETTVATSDTAITVSSGDGSYEVAKKLEKAGVIKDSKEYDTYLCQKGYDRRITTGKHVIKKGATEEEIAKELMTRVNK